MRRSSPVLLDATLVLAGSLLSTAGKQSGGRRAPDDSWIAASAFGLLAMTIPSGRILVKTREFLTPPRAA